MVCLGNICRSPLAEGILRSKLLENDFFIDSAGTAAYHIGNKPDRRSIAVANKYNIDITNLRGRQFIEQDFDEFDLIYAMDSLNLRHILNLARSKEDEAKVKLILNELAPNEDLSVPDPYYGGDQGFENVYQMLDASCQVIANKLLS